ncbi:hypothetical protein SAVIM338S_02279 [Streptomyces avidinii]
MTRSTYRFVDLTIRHVPEGGVIWETFCRTEGCGLDSGPCDSQEAAQDWALRHSGVTDHDLFKRVVTDNAEVMYAEDSVMEKDRDSLLRR